MMGGEIWIESEPGHGTTFNFTADFGLGKETVKRRFEPSPDLRGLKALVVDNNAISREILQAILGSFSFEIFLAASGEDALEEIERADNDQPFELLILLIKIYFFAKGMILSSGADRPLGILRYGPSVKKSADTHMPALFN